MTEIPVVVAAERLEAFLVEAWLAMKAPRPQAELAAALMVRTDLRGVDSHGIDMLPRYHEWWRQGFIVPDAEPVVVRDEAATALVDGRRGLGHWVAAQAMGRAIDKARAHGIGIVAVRNSNHFGAAACYAMMALAHDLIGLATTNSPYVAMVPTFGRRAMLATNPLAFAAPAGRHAPFVLDMATTTVAIGKIRQAARWKRPIPAGWALDPAGRPVTDPVEALEHRLLSPLGGTPELASHKGYGLGVMVDILSGILAGAVYGDRFARSDRPARRVHDVGHCFVAVDPARFRPLEEFKRDMDDLFDALKATPPAAGQRRVYVAGEPEAECEARRRREGIPLAPALVDAVNAVARALGIAPLA